MVQWLFRLYCKLFHIVTNGAIITDCHDDSAKGRLLTRWRAMFGRWSPTFIGIVAPTEELEHGSDVATMHLFDQIDAARSPEKRRWWHFWKYTVIIINSASRGESHNRPNGSPFCYWWVDKYTLVVCTIDGPVVPHANSLGLIPDGIVYETDIVEVCDFAAAKGVISWHEAKRIPKSQFRSLEYEPLLAKLVIKGWKVPHIVQAMASYNPNDGHAFFGDNFGNLTIDKSPEQFGYVEGDRVRMANGEFGICVPELKDVPRARPGDKPIFAFTIGSNGVRDPETGVELRFIELVVMRGHASNLSGFKEGDVVVLEADIPANRRAGDRTRVH